MGDAGSMDAAKHAKTPPHSMEAEESVLGGLLYQNQSLLALPDLNLLPEDLYRQASIRESKTKKHFSTMRRRKFSP